MKTDYGRYETADIYAVAPDNFKLINEMYGLDGGNAILHVLSARLSKAFGDKELTVVFFGQLYGYTVLVMLRSFSVHASAWSM